MKNESIHQFENYVGVYRHVLHAPGALESWDEASSRLKVAEAITVEGRFIGYFLMWANENRLPSLQMVRREGDLPGGTAFYALEHGRIRAYFWYSKRRSNTLVVSHYIRKSRRKLRKRDIERARRNWYALGEGEKT